MRFHSLLRTPEPHEPNRRQKPVRGRGIAVAALALAVSATALLGGCGSTATQRDMTSMFKPYRADVIQGNFVSREMAEELKPGMTKEQVQAIMGTPLLSTIFNQNRWEYVFSLRQGYQEPIVRRFTVYFDKEGKMVRADGDPLPSEEEFVAQINALRDGGRKPKSLTEAQLQAEIAAADKKFAQTKRPQATASQPGNLTVYAPPSEIAALQNAAPLVAPAASAAASAPAAQ
ncbi:MAG: outer membrane protein assembly factor BamE [Thiomonas sp.]|nr:outer membrane protein assembly factor BamE [Thiomonas sp.]